MKKISKRKISNIQKNTKLFQKKKIVEESVSKKSLINYGFGSDKLGFFKKNFFPYAYPLIIVGFVSILLLIVDINELFFDKSTVFHDIYGLWILYFILLVVLFFWSILQCILFGTLTNFTFLDGLLPLLKCDLKKLDLNAFLRLPFVIFLLILVSLILSGLVIFFGAGYGLTPYFNEIFFVILFVLFLIGVFKTSKVIESVCKADVQKYLLSIVFVLLNYIQILVLFTVLIVFLVITVFFVTAL